ncbi:molybdopterin converting factor subunit 1 [Reinekea marinisedimentorum]|uniref:Molybdopterin synthase sulfur carrier subunit n=1 Tax=Reinekea marinisedimentorum TaxID=230495 RepID=A0A4R3I4L8_9GAMM|nr:molybdopterin converting factor subunit 1 [Reinekea marinisedimentorum]TCS40176.1 molybdopterin synthase sulfur carrier subunit [Reinekea marinisedimentorum]
MNTITVKFFARLREQSGVDAMDLEIGDMTKLSELIAQLQDQHQDWTILQQKNLMAAVNHSMITDDCLLAAGDEVALFPPVTGG